MVLRLGEIDQQATAKWLKGSREYRKPQIEAETQCDSNKQFVSVK